MESKLVGATLAVGAAGLAHGRLHSIEPLVGVYPDAPTKVIIVGGGFGGLAAVEKLARVFGGSGEVGVALIDRVNYTTFWPMVPSAIPRNVEVRHVAHSLRRIVAPLGAEFFQGEVTGVDFETKEVRTDKGSFPYDYLILAPGSRTAFFGASSAREHAIDLKGVADALRVRNTVIDRFEEAEWLQGNVGDALMPFCYRSPGQLVDLGESSALTDILGVKISGVLGGLIWKGVYLYELGYNLNRAQVLADWLISLFARPDTSKLFEEER